MYDPTFGPTALDRHIRKSDFKTLPALAAPALRAATLNSATKIAQAGFASLALAKSDLGGRAVYRLTDLPTDLILRKAAQNLRKISKTKQSNRIEIVRKVKLLCEEGMPFCLSKFDISRFYESIDQNAILDLIERRLSTSAGTRRVLKTFVQQCMANGISGLPRGLAISAALSEFFMQDFDRFIQQQLSTHFYARYVDDIICVLPPAIASKGLRKQIAFMLPKGLHLNANKTRILNFGTDSTSTSVVEHEFDYLGFSFKVDKTKNKPTPVARLVTLDIASSKVRKRKTRIVRALRQYLQDGNFVDLVDRFKIITCNYRFYDHRKDRTRLAGNLHTYGMIDMPSNALLELDIFTKHLLLSKMGKVSGPLALSLTKQQRQTLLGLSFIRGFEQKTHFHFTPERLNQLVECWKYA